MRHLTILATTAMAGALVASTAAAGVATGNVNLRTQPTVQAPRITTIPAGAQVQVHSCPSWCNVTYAGHTGWASSNYIDPGGEVSGSLVALAAVLFVWGGATAGLYTAGLAHLASRFSGGELASANAAFVFCYASGMLAGPLVIGDAMARAPAHGFPLVLAIVFAAYAVIVAVRMRRARPG